MSHERLLNINDLVIVASLLLICSVNFYYLFMIMQLFKRNGISTIVLYLITMGFTITFVAFNYPFVYLLLQSRRPI